MKNIVAIVSEIKIPVRDSVTESQEIINNYNMGFITIIECSSQLTEVSDSLKKNLAKFDKKDVQDAYIIINYEYIKN